MSHKGIIIRNTINYSHPFTHLSFAASSPSQYSDISPIIMSNFNFFPTVYIAPDFISLFKYQKLLAWNLKSVNYFLNILLSNTE